jgi:hypothetical protein
MTNISRLRIYEATIDVKDFFKQTSVLTPWRLKMRWDVPVVL